MVAPASIVEKPIILDSPSSTPTPTPTPTPIKTNDPTDFVSSLKVASQTDKLIIVIGKGGPNATLSFHKKNASGVWTQEFSADADVGKNGITYSKREGDKKTPGGIYNFTLAFGINPDPKTKIEYRKLTDSDYWIDDSNSPYYNQWVDSSTTKGTFTSEHLIDYLPSYTYALNINYNTKCTPGAGSAIFLHCKSGAGSTAGCIAISLDRMRSLIQQVDSKTKILIVPNANDLDNY